MPLKHINNYNIDDAKHERLWKNALVVFDTSALLDMYFYSGKTKQVVIDEIFKKLSGRLWIPYQVNYEFLKNRSKVILKPIASYLALEKDFKDTINDVYKKYQTGISELKSKTKKDDKHPVLDQHIFEKLDEIHVQNEAALKELSEKIKDTIKVKTEEIESTTNSDVLYDAIDTYFEVGIELSFAEQMELVEEGKKRYEVQIPPGYEDGTGKDKKEGTQIFGDLFFWKEIIRQVKKTKQPVILIGNDVKADWCVKNENNPTYVEHPRHELIKEIWDEAGVEFWMYSNPQLLFHAQKYLKSEISRDQIKEVNAVANLRRTSGDAHLACTFTWPVDATTNTSGENLFEKSLMYLFGNQDKSLKVDWGDDSPLEIVHGRHAVYHKYPATGEYTVTIYGDLFWFCAMGIGTERGIQFPKVSELSFINSGFLDRLQSVGGTLEKLDLTKMPNLTQLFIGHNQLHAIDTTGLLKLGLLYCENNQLSELKTSENIFLSKLDCSGNKLAQLDLSSNNILEKLDCRGNELTRIDLTNNSNLIELNCAHNKLDENALNDIFTELPVVSKGRICIKGNPGTDGCYITIATTKGWIIEPDPDYIKSNW